MLRKVLGEKKMFVEGPEASSSCEGTDQHSKAEVILYRRMSYNSCRTDLHFAVSAVHRGHTRH